MDVGVLQVWSPSAAFPETHCPLLRHSAEVLLPDFGPCHHQLLFPSLGLCSQSLLLWAFWAFSAGACGNHLHALMCCLKRITHKIHLAGRESSAVASVQDMCEESTRLRVNMHLWLCCSLHSLSCLLSLLLTESLERSIEMA